jgi:hypothetical protein
MQSLRFQQLYQYCVHDCPLSYRVFLGLGVLHLQMIGSFTLTDVSVIFIIRLDSNPGPFEY